jgi:hypothetical protein
MDQIGKQDAYPSDDSFGMTYRQWLIGMALQGEMAADAEGVTKPDEHAKAAIEAADAVLVRLERELTK